MRIIILGGDGYLGWPTAMHFAAKGHEVWTIDNYLRRRIALETCSEPLIPTPNLTERAAIYESLTGRRVRVTIGDCTDDATIARLFDEARPDAVIHYAEQPSAPFSMMGRANAQLAGLNRHGFGDVRVLSSRGEELDPRALEGRDDPWLYYLCRRLPSDGGTSAAADTAARPSAPLP